MTKLIENEQLKIALMNVDKYKDFAEFEKYKNYDYEYFKHCIDSGFILDITLGVYNGATDSFTLNEINDKHILDAIFCELHESDFYNIGDDESWYIETKNYTKSDWIREFTECFNVFVINDRIFVDES